MALAIENNIASTIINSKNQNPRYYSKMSELLELSVDDIQNLTTNNAKKLFEFYEENDFTITQQNILLSPFMFPYFYDLRNINSKMIVINE